MNTSIIVLLIILFVLMVSIGGKRGIRSFFSILQIGIIFISIMIFIAMGFNPIITTLLGCTLISFVLLFYTNGVHNKTVFSSFAVLIAIVLTLIITYPVIEEAKIQGFSFEQYEQLSFASHAVDIDFTDIILCEILIGLLGAVIDVSISIATAMTELKLHEPEITRRRLFVSGVKIGRDILGTMTHTLLFAYIGGFFSIMVWFSALEYPLSYTLNSKLFTSEIFQIICGGIGIIIVIPIITLLMLKQK